MYYLSSRLLAIRDEKGKMASGFFLCQIKFSLIYLSSRLNFSSEGREVKKERRIE